MKNLLRVITLFVAVTLAVVAEARSGKAPGDRTPIGPVSDQRPELGAFMQSLWEHSPKIEEARARAESAQARQRAASKWLYNPELEFELEDKDGEDKTRLFGLSQGIDLSGKSRASGRVAEFDYKAVLAERDAVQQDVTLDVLRSLVENRTAKSIAALFDQRVELMTRFTVLAAKGLRAGDIDTGEMNLARLALSETLIRQAEVQASMTESRQRLEELLGFGLARNVALPELPVEFPKLSWNAGSLDETVMQLSEIRALRNRLDSSIAAIKRARLDRRPDPTISVRGGQEEGTDMVGLSVSVPLNIFNTYGAEVVAAEQDSRAEEKAFHSASNAAKAGLQASHQRYELSVNAWRVWETDGAQALSSQIETLDRKYAVGDLSATDYLVQVEQALDTEIAALELRRSVWLSWFDWLAASGKVVEWISDFEEKS